MAGLQGGGEEWGVWRGRKEQGTAPPVGAAGGRRRTPDPISPPASAAGGSGPRRQAPSAPAPRRAPPPRRQAQARARAGCSGAGYSGMAMLKLKNPCTRRSGIDRMAGAMMSVIAAFTMIIAVTSTWSQRPCVQTLQSAGACAGNGSDCSEYFGHDGYAAHCGSCNFSMRSSIYVFGTDGLKGLLNTVKLNRLNAIIAM